MLRKFNLHAGILAEYVIKKFKRGYNNENWLPLKDLFVNQKLELEQDLDSYKILFNELHLPHPQRHYSA